MGSIKSYCAMDKIFLYLRSKKVTDRTFFSNFVVVFFGLGINICTELLMENTRELITLQFGSFANHVGCHLWNTQVRKIRLPAIS